ncbi:MAG: acyl-CoA synthetase [Nitrococcus sp.]|nr:acyl-CoA synthetase [Nitrococcus sp.]
MEKASGKLFEQHLERNEANYVALSPLTFIERTAAVFPEHSAVIYGELERSWAQTYERVRRLASALRAHGVERGDTVAVMLANTPEMLEAHFAVPMAGAVLNALDVRQEARAIAFILQDSEANVLITDTEFAQTIEKALDTLSSPPLVIDVDDSQVPAGERLGKLDYEALLAEGDPAFTWESPQDEWDAIAVNYTSGTTGNPKGVVYHHRGAYLNAVSHILVWGMAQQPVYLWTLPMFDCNGWCFPWTITAMAGTHVCMRQVRAEAVLEAIRRYRVSYFCASPAVLNTLLAAPAKLRRKFHHPVKVMTAAAAPAASVIAGIEAMGIELTHVYGLTEAYGPATVCVRQPQWDTQPPAQRARLKARQGVRYPMLEGLMVADPAMLEPVPKDGRTIGEVFLRGNTVMKGYLKSTLATDEAFAGGWFHTGDLAIWHADGYVEIKDRSKDIITAGGEKLSSLEIESVLCQHPAIMEAAVVGRHDDQWGETPCAFVSLKPQADDVSAEEIIEFCRQSLAHSKVPKTVVFCELPKTANGKVQKFKLRAYAWRL